MDLKTFAMHLPAISKFLINSATYFFLPAHTVLQSHVLKIMMLNKPKFV